MSNHGPYSDSVCGLEAEGPVQSNHCEEKGRRVRLDGRSLPSKRLVSRAIAGVQTLNAVSDGASPASGSRTRMFTA